MTTTTTAGVEMERRSTGTYGMTTGRGLRRDYARRLALRIRQARERCGKTQYQAAADAGIEQQSLTLYEAGKRIPSLPNLERLARALHVAPADLLEPSEDIAESYRKIAASARDE